MSRRIDSYVENTLDLVPLDLPNEDLIDESDIDLMEALNQAITIQVNLPNSRFGPGRVTVAIHPGYKRALFMGVSPNMFRRGLKKSAVLDAGLRVYSKCWDKPTTAGVAGCVVETFIEWLMT
ncbi:MAG: hypothetical protein FOGNACKC_04341 [Anaerolineae bacterium]|nr:hypothetical protein [Anaerolineae bacterium]